MCIWHHCLKQHLWCVHLPIAQGYHPQLSIRPDYKRNGNPVNITNYVKTSAAQANEVVIFWAHDILYPMVCVYVCVGGEGEWSRWDEGLCGILSQYRSLTCFGTCLHFKGCLLFVGATGVYCLCTSCFADTCLLFMLC